MFLESGVQRSFALTIVHVGDVNAADQLADCHHVEDALKADNYDDWALHLPNKSRAKPTSTTRGDPQPTKKKPMLGLPYIKGVS